MVNRRDGVGILMYSCKNQEIMSPQKLSETPFLLGLKTGLCACDLHEDNSDGRIDGFWRPANVSSGGTSLARPVTRPPTEERTTHVWYLCRHPYWDAARQTVIVVRHEFGKPLSIDSHIFLDPYWHTATQTVQLLGHTLFEGMVHMSATQRYLLGSKNTHI